MYIYQSVHTYVYMYTVIYIYICIYLLIHTCIYIYISIGLVSLTNIEEFTNVNLWLLLIHGAKAPNPRPASIYHLFAAEAMLL